MATIPKQIEIRRILLEKNLRIFSERDFRLLFDLNPWVAKYHLNRQSQPDGLFIRLKKGLYALRTDFPSDEEIANRLYQPSYLSLEYALSKYGLIPESVYQITSVTTKPTRIFTVNGKTYSYTKIKKQAYTGYQLANESGIRFLIAEPIKAVIDYLYLMLLGNKPENDRLLLENLYQVKGPINIPQNIQTIYQYAKLYNRKKLIKYLKQRIPNA